jgi:hypothetical protein
VRFSKEEVAMVEKDLLRYMETRLGLDVGSAASGPGSKKKKSAAKKAEGKYFVQNNSVCTATKTLQGDLVETFESIVEYEPWMDNFGNAKGGISVVLGTEAGDRIERLHPEIWFDGDEKEAGAEGAPTNEMDIGEVLGDMDVDMGDAWMNMDDR